MSLFTKIVGLGKSGERVRITGGTSWTRVTTAASGGGYTTGAGDQIVGLTGYSANGLVTLSSANAVNGQRIRVIDLDHNVLGYEFKVVASSGYIGVSGQTAWHLLRNGMAVEFVFDGTNWSVHALGGDDVVQDVALWPAVSSGLLVEFRADTGTTIATGVSSWATRNAASGFNKSADNATGSQQPTVTSNWSRGQPALTFAAASSQRLITAAWTGSAVTQPYTIYLVIELTDSVNNTQRPIIDGIGGSNRSLIIADVTAGSLQMTSATPNVPTGAVTGSNSINHKRVVAAVFNNDGLPFGRLYANAGLLGEGSPGTQVPTGFTLGANQTVANFYNGKMAYAALFQGGHTYQQVEGVTRRLRNWYAFGAGL